MAISNRLRFEILRRDGFTCNYCGRSAPDVQLTVDHVIPQALGGTDIPSNLVAACQECNGGKTSSAPDQSLVSEVDRKAVKWSAAMAQAAQEMRNFDDDRNDIYVAVFDSFPSYYGRRIPGDYTETIDRFLDAGIPADVIVAMAGIAAYKPKVYDRWAYFCGCCWTRLRQMQERAAEILTDGDDQDG